MKSESDCQLYPWPMGGPSAQSSFHYAIINPNPQPLHESLALHLNLLPFPFHQSLLIAFISQFFFISFFSFFPCPFLSFSIRKTLDNESLSLSFFLVLVFFCHWPPLHHDHLDSSTHLRHLVHFHSRARCFSDHLSPPTAASSL